MRFRIFYRLKHQLNMELTIDEYIAQCENNLRKLELLEEYEYCQSLHDLIQSLKTRDVKSYIKLNFDIPVLKKVGFLKKTDDIKDIETRITKFFELNNIFEYSTIGGGMCCLFTKLTKQYNLDYLV